MEAVCEECGDAGFRDLLLRCSKCKSAARHRYCLDVIIFDVVVDWSCSGCIPKSNEAMKSLEDASNQMQLSNTHLGCSMVNEPNVDNEKVPKARRPLSVRAHRKMKYHVGESTKHSPSGDTSNLGQCRKKPQKDRRDGSDTISAQFCSGDAIDSCEVLVGDIPNRNDCEKEGEDRNGHLTCAVESSDGSSNLPLHHTSEFEPNNLQKAMNGAELASNSVDCTDLSDVGSVCFASLKHVEAPRGMGDTFSLTNNVEGSLPMIMDKSHPTSASMEQAGLSLNMVKSEALKPDKGLEKNLVASKFAPNLSKPIQGSDLKTGSADVLDPLKQHLGSGSVVPIQSSPSNELEDVAVQESSAERTRCLVDEETNVPTMENVKASMPSMANECLVSNEGNSDKAGRTSDEVLLSTKGKRMPRRMSGDKVNGISTPESSKDDRDARNLQRNEGQPSSLDVKKAPLERVLQQEAINNELLSSKFVGPCESTKVHPRKRKQSAIYTPDGTNHQKTTTTNEDKIVNNARSEGGRPAPASSFGDGQNMPREENGSNAKVTGHSKKKRKYKKIDSLQPSSPHTSSVGKSRACSENMDLALKESTCPLNNPRSSRARKMKKRNIDANKDENASVRNQNAGCAESDVSKLPLQTVVKKGYCGISRMPLIPECIGTRPLDNSYWTGIMKVDGNYIPLSAHLSTQAGKKAQELSRSLPPKMEVSKLSTSKSCPKHLEAPIPSAESIDLYFFCGDARPNKELDQLVKHVADSGITLEAIVGSAKLFLFPSFVLPEEYQMFQGKPFLWGVFKEIKDNKMKRLAPVEQDSTFTAHMTKEVPEQHLLDEQEKVHGDTLEQVVRSENQPMLDANANQEEPSVDHVQEQHVLDQQDKAHGDPSDQVVHSENQPLLDANPNQEEVGKEAFSGNNGLPSVDHVQEQHVCDQQDKAHGDTLEQVVHSENRPSLDANPNREVGKEAFSGNGLPLVDMNALVSANISPADHGQHCSSPEARPPQVCGFVVARTPRSVQLIQQMQKEGAFLFAVQQVMTEHGSVV